MTTTHPATAGQRVIYTGSLKAYRGPAVYVGVCDADERCADCEALFDLWEFHGAPGDAPIRYRLDLGGGQHLRCVRAESITAIVPDTTAAQA